ncbi:lipid-A-disaccharide synthase [Ectothiorhodosinus mongolicus]|nr:lipid-A-disaccharide synthase [Ectothiorhodosinus mongolicus]
MPQDTGHIMVVAGESSGDLHAANMVRALKALRPGLRFSGMGCEAMAEAGVARQVDASRLGVVGLWEVLAQYRQIKKALNTLKQALRRDPPDLLVLVDYVEFNLRLAKAAKALGIRVLFYVSPQIWAWRSGRARKIGAVIDAMAVLFPFEVDIYRQHGIPVRYVGNPLVDVVRVDGDHQSCCQSLGLDPERPILGLLPGSRSSEQKNHLPIMLETAALLRQALPELQVAVALPAKRQLSASLQEQLARQPDIRLCSGQTYALMAVSRALIVASGTATLEAALMKTPMAIIYRISPLSYAILKRLIRIPHIGLANIVAGKPVAPEYIQAAATAEALSAWAQRILSDDRYHQHMVEDLDIVRERLGASGGSERVACMALELLDHGRLLEEEAAPS